FFFFQAEDGIRDFHVTGVQTCALPISEGPNRTGYWIMPAVFSAAGACPRPRRQPALSSIPYGWVLRVGLQHFPCARANGPAGLQIGRASCRERGWEWTVRGVVP